MKLLVDKFGKQVTERMNVRKLCVRESSDQTKNILYFAEHMCDSTCLNGMHICVAAYFCIF